MITVTGRTFEHRVFIQSLGGVWNKENKSWVIKHANPADIERLTKTVGLIVTVYDEKPTHKPWDDKPTIYGDDPTYLNYFAPKNPRAFFGFSSLGKMINYIEKLPRFYALDPDRAGWNGGNASQYGTDTMREALDIARKGWPEGADAAQGIIDRLTLAKPRIRHHKPSVAGGIVNVGRMLSGDPRHMILRPKQPGKKIVTLFVETGCYGGIDTGTMIRRSAIVGAIADIMENESYSCTIVAVDTSIYQRKTFYQLAVTLKKSGERLNLGDLMFALGHPSFLRRFSFAVCSSVPETQEIWSHQGSPSNAFTNDHPCGPNEFYVPVIEENTIDVDTTIPYVIPENLPINFE
jgi:hypothetical protein